jgi:hypothetical protein
VQPFSAAYGVFERQGFLLPAVFFKNTVRVFHTYLATRQIDELTVLTVAEDDAGK